MSNFTLRTKIYALIGLFVVAFAATTLLLLLEISRQAEQDGTFTVSQVNTQNSARVIQLNFKKQVQAWKDVLLRGHDPANFKKYSDEFSKQEAEVRTSALALEDQVPDDTTKTELTHFLASHQTMGNEYRRRCKSSRNPKDGIFAPPTPWSKAKTAPSPTPSTKSSLT